MATTTTGEIKAEKGGPATSDTGIASLFRGNLRQYTMVIAFLVIVVLFAILTDGISVLPDNVYDLVQQNGSVLILAIGMMLCILTGGNIDLSVGSVVCLTGAIAGFTLYTSHLPLWLGLTMEVAAGFAVGAFQGALIAYVRIPSFIVTLAGMLIFRGVAYVLLQGQSLPLPEEYRTITNGSIPDPFHIPGFKLFPGDRYDFNFLCLAVGLLLALLYVFFTIRKRNKKRRYDFEVTPTWLVILQMFVVSSAILVFFLWLARSKGISIVLVIVGILAAGYTFFMQKTVPGRYIYAMGGNEKAARLSGIDTRKVMFFVYMNMGVLASLAGIVASSRLGSAAPTAGQGNELDSIGACFIGGASMSGGVGTIMGSSVGALIMGEMILGMNSSGKIDNYWQMIIKGLVVLIAVAFDMFAKSRAKK